MANLTKPVPRDCPEFLSRSTFLVRMVPKPPKSSSSISSEAEGPRLQIYRFVCFTLVPGGRE